MYKLLIVDDEPAIVEGLAEMISSKELPLKEIRFAYSASEAQGYLSQSPFDIVLADIRMPKMSGLEWVESIRSTGWMCKVILLTGYSDFEYTKKALQLGVSDYLLKPAEDDEVISSLRKVIGELDRKLEEMMAIEKARTKLQASNSQLRNQIWIDFLNQPRTKGATSLQSTMKLLDASFDYEQDLFLVLIRIDDWGERFNSDDASLIRFAVQNMAEEMLNNAFRVESFHLDYGLSGMLLQPASFQEDECARIAFMVESAQNTIYRMLGVSISIMFQSSAIDWAELGPLFRMMWDDLNRLTAKGLLIDSADAGDESASADGERGASVLIEQLKAYIVNHLSEDLSLDQLSRRFYVNPTYLSRLFKQTTNEVLSFYITKEKMNVARRLLLQDGMKVGEVAKQVGYHNPNYFAKVFRNLYGMSPQEYKTRMFL